MSVLLIGRHKRKKTLKISVNHDLFFSKSNIEYLERVTSDIDNGTAKLEEHELIEI